VVDGIVYFGSNDDHIYALDAGTGREEWRFNAGGDVRSAIAIVEGVAYFVSGRDLYAIDSESGEEKWRFRSIGRGSPPSVAGDMVYFGAANGLFHAVSTQTGTEVWNFQAESGLSDSAAIAEGVVYLANSDGLLYALC
jgi:outer membrane protein assembly factor BamB